MAKRLKIVITGSDGYIGLELVKKLKNDFKLFCPSIKELDITNFDNINSYFIKIKPDILIHLAGISNPDICLKNIEYSRAVNILGSMYLSNICARLHTKFIYMSSSSALSKSNEYGKQKHHAEEHIKKDLKNYLIIRCDKVYNEKSKFILDTINKFKNNDFNIESLMNRYYPIFLDDLVQNIKECIELNILGEINLAPSQGISKKDWKILIKKIFGYKQKTILSENYFDNTRPLDSKMDTSLIFKYNLTIPRSIEDGIKTIKERLS